MKKTLIALAVLAASSSVFAGSLAGAGAAGVTLAGSAVSGGSNHHSSSAIAGDLAGTQSSASAGSDCRGVYARQEGTSFNVAGGAASKHADFVAGGAAGSVQGAGIVKGSFGY